MSFMTWDMRHDMREYGDMRYWHMVHVIHHIVVNDIVNDIVACYSDMVHIIHHHVLCHAPRCGACHSPMVHVMHYSHSHMVNDMHHSRMVTCVIQIWCMSFTTMSYSLVSDSLFHDVCYLRNTSLSFIELSIYTLLSGQWHAPYLTLSSPTLSSLSLYIRTFMMYMWHPPYLTLFNLPLSLTTSVTYAIPRSLWSNSLYLHFNHVNDMHHIWRSLLWLSLLWRSLLWRSLLWLSLLWRSLLWLCITALNSLHLPFNHVHHIHNIRCLLHTQHLTLFDDVCYIRNTSLSVIELSTSTLESCTSHPISDVCYIPISDVRYIRNIRLSLITFTCIMWMTSDNEMCRYRDISLSVIGLSISTH